MIEKYASKRDVFVGAFTLDILHFATAQRAFQSPFEYLEDMNEQTSITQDLGMES